VTYVTGGSAQVPDNESMPIVIGAKPESNFADPIGLLTDCHRRIERFLNVLVRVAADAQGAPLTPEQRTAFETALRYFRDAAPKHTADEESTLFPRLRAHPEARAVLEQIDALEGDHQRADRGHAEVDRLGREWLEAGSLPPAVAAQLNAVLVELSDLYRAHIALEESSVFPAAAKALPEADRLAMGKEMAARRGL
jgi:hemerythrin-like domain-containing protein